MSWPEAPQLPSVAVPERIPLPEATLEVPEAELPKYPPLVLPPSNLQPPPGIEGIDKDPPPEEDQETKAPAPSAPKVLPPEAQLIEVPFTDVEVPMPTTEIMTTAATTAFISVAATLTATSLFKWLVTVMKPVFKQTWNKLTKKKEPEAS